MPWILLLIAIACFAVPFFTTSFALGAFCLVFSLLLILVAMMMLLSSRVGDATRSAPMLSADELRVMREIAERQRTDTVRPATDSAQATNPPSTTDTAPPSI